MARVALASHPFAHSTGLLRPYHVYTLALLARAVRYITSIDDLRFRSAVIYNLLASTHLKVYCTVLIAVLRMS